METVLDVFNQDAFGVVALTDSINKMPFAPSRASVVVDWNEEGVPTTSVAIETKGNNLTLVNPTPRGGPGETRAKVRRSAGLIPIPHYEINDGINADEVQGVREFGQGNQTMTVQNLVNARMAQHAADLDATLEYQRVGAIKGIILNGDGTTLLNVFTSDALGATPQTEVDMNLDGATADGSVRAACTAVVRSVSRGLGNMPFAGVYAFCSDTFWDALIKNVEVRATYLAQQEASQLRSGVAWEALSFGGIIFENYRGGVGAEEATKFFEDDKAYAFPIGGNRVFRTIYGPADYVQTVNTIGLPRYAKIMPWDNDKGVGLDVQANAISYCTRPRALVKLKIT